MRRIFVASATLLVIAAVTAACSSNSGTGSPATTTSPGSTNLPARHTTPVVDLTFTGTVNVVAKGSAGTCQLGRHSDGSIVSFGFNATEADYPGLGTNLNFTEDVGSHRMDFKWLVRAPDVTWFGVMEGGVTISPDHRSVTLDADLPKNPGKPEHVKGTIACNG